MSIDRLLLKALRSSDEQKVHQAFEQTYKQYYHLIFCCIYRLVPQKEIVEELTNDTFIKVFNRLSYLDERGNLKQYLAKTAKNLAYDYLRLKKLDIVPFSENLIAESEKHSGNSYMIISQYLDDLELSIVLEHLIYDRTFKHISQEMKMSANTIASIYRRALNKLKKKIKREDLR